MRSERSQPHTVWFHLYAGAEEADYREKVVQWLCRAGKTESTANRFWFLFGLMETF